MTNNKVAVYIVTYNRAQMLKETLVSVVNQTYKNIDIYVLDNCSTDSTKEVVEKFNDERIQYICHEKNIGGIGNINYAINNNKNDFFVIFHDDDRMLPNMIEEEIAIMENNDEIVIVSGNGYFFSEQKDKNSELEKMFIVEEDNIYKGRDCVENYLSKNKTLVFPSIMYRNSFFIKNKIKLIENVGPCADVVFYSDIALAGGEIYELKKPIMEYRLHSGQDTFKNYFSMHIALFDYFTKTKRYKGIMHRYKKKEYNGWVIKAICFYFADKITKTQMMEYRKGFRNSLEIEDNNVVDLFYFFALRIPGVSKWGYRCLKKIKICFKQRR